MMTLHEAIESILQETGKPMTSSEIAEIINKKNLYTRKDKLPVSASQIMARVGNYEKLFSKESGKIKLIKDDVVSLKLQRYKNEISYMRGRTTDPKIVIETLKDLENQTKDRNTDLDFGVMEEPSSYYRKEEISREEKYKITYELIEWFLSQNSPYEVWISDQFASFFSKLEWFEKGSHSIAYFSNLSNHSLLKIAYDNPKSKFVLTGSPDRDFQFKSIQEINNHIENLFSQRDSDKISRLSTGIFIPPFLKGAQWREICAKILDDLSLEDPHFDRAVIIMPSNILYSRVKEEIFFRQELTQSGYLDSTIQFPTGMLEHASVSTAAFILDFSKSNTETFFLDAASLVPSRAAEIVNQKQNIPNVSSIANYEDIVANGMNLSPGEYVWQPEDIVLEPGYNLYTISEIIRDKKIGIAIPRKKLYPEGEFKIIRTSEITEDSLYLNSKNVILGVDHDEVGGLEKRLVTGGIIISGFNKKLKANILPPNKSYVVGMDVYWLQLDHKIVLDQYFVREIQEVYVQHQVGRLSKGQTIMRLSLNDLLKIKIKIPVLEEQKDLLLTELQKTSDEVKSGGNGDYAVDFINTLEHSLRQPASSLGNDLLSLRDFINNKINLKETLNFDEPVVPIFDTDTPEQIAIHSLSNTLERMHRMLTDIEYILTQAGSLAKAKASPIMELIELQPFLNNFISENQDIKIVISGNAEIIADRKQLRILFNNLIANAKKHGFQNQIASPTIWIEVNSKDQFGIHIYVRNNGKPLPKEFTTEQFLAKGRSTDEAVGSGFGGFLMGQILKNHNGSIELIQRDFSLMPYKVEFKITLPK